MAAKRLYTVNKRLNYERHIDERIRRTVSTNELVRRMEYDTFMRTYVVRAATTSGVRVKYVRKARVGTGGRETGCTRFPGLTRAIRSRWFPGTRVSASGGGGSSSSTRAQKAGRGSSRIMGKRIHNEIFKYMSEPARSLSDFHSYTRAIVEFLVDESLETMQISEMPCVGVGASYATQADLITRTTDGDLVLYEVKTGFLRADDRRGGGVMAPPLNIVYDNAFNAAHLQLLYTMDAIHRTTCVRIARCHVLNVYHDNVQDKVVVKRLPNPTWFQMLLGNATDRRIIIGALQEHRKRKKGFRRYVKASRRNGGK